MDGVVMAWQPRPVERMKPSTPAPPRAVRALAMTRREAACLGAGLGAVVLSWVTALTIL